MLYKTIEELKSKCNEYLEKNTIVAPRSFRLSLGVSKHLLSTWKKTNPDFFNLIKTYEDAILAKIEEYAIYGEAHPDIKELLTDTSKFNQVGAIFTLRAYDRDQYVPEIAQENARALTDSDGAKLIEIITPRKDAKKGSQSVRSIETIK